MDEARLVAVVGACGGSRVRGVRVLEAVEDAVFGMTFVVGLEPDKEEPKLLRVYLGARYKHVYALIEDPEVQADIQNAWAGGGHVIVPIPPEDALFFDEEGYAAMKDEQAERSLE